MPHYKRSERAGFKRFYFFAVILLFACNNGGAPASAREAPKQHLTGYVAFLGEKGYFMDCASKKRYSLAESAPVEQLRQEYEALKAEGNWVYAEISGESTGAESFLPEEYGGLSVSAFCEGDIIFFSLSNRFLGIGKGVNVGEVGERYGPIIFTRPRPGGGNYSNEFDMHTARKTALVSFFTDEAKNILHYEVRDPDIFLVSGVHTGMVLEEVRSRIPDLQLQVNGSRYGMTVAGSEETGLEFIFTEDYNASRTSLEELDPQSRLYLIRY